MMIMCVIPYLLAILAQLKITKNIMSLWCACSSKNLFFYFDKISVSIFVFPGSVHWFQQVLPAMKDVIGYSNFILTSSQLDTYCYHFRHLVRLNQHSQRWKIHT